jgi:glycosyltransferase involved in cell wall biosynthesis
MSRLRLLLVASELGWEGGIGRVVAGAARTLAARGHEVHVAGPAPFGDPGPIPGAVVHPWPRRRLVAAQLLDLLPLQERLFPQVLHLHAARPSGEIVAVLRGLARGPGAPVLAVTPYTSRGFAKRRARLALRAADGVLAGSRWGEAQAHAAGAHAQTTFVAPAGVDVPPPPGLDARHNLVCFLGRLEMAKGPDVLLDAFVRAAAMRPGWRLVFAGTGSLTPALERAAAAGLCAERVAFLGHVSGAAKTQLLTRAGIGVVPSRRDNFPGALLELMAHGAACVGSAVGAIPEIADAGRAARLVPPADFDALALALAELMDDAERRRSLATAGRRAAERLAWPVVVERWEEAYRALLERRQ